MRTKDKLKGTAKKFLLGIYDFVVIVLKMVAWVIFLLVCFYLFFFVFN